jgi:hypothetical protein
MKTITIMVMMAICCSELKLNAQTKSDSLAIEKACRDYVEGWATGDADRVARGVSPELVKRTIGQDKDGTSYSNNMSASLLLVATRSNREGVRGKDLEPDKPFKLEVHIFDVTPDYALVKTVTTKYGFFDYCQLARFNGEWKIFNVLWGWLPQK